VDLVHLKDYRIGQLPHSAFQSLQAGDVQAFRRAFEGVVQFAEVGEGNLDFKAIINQSLTSGAKYLLIEQDNQYAAIHLTASPLPGTTSFRSGMAISSEVLTPNQCDLGQPGDRSAAGSCTSPTADCPSRRGTDVDGKHPIAWLNSLGGDVDMGSVVDQQRPVWIVPSFNQANSP
jgi:hypothetical protein